MISKPHYTDDSVTLYRGDCLDVLPELPDASVDAEVTDPPYGIRFMGKAWDGADIEARTARGRVTCPMPEGVGGPRGGYRSLAAEAGRYDLSANAAFGEWCAAWAAECLRILKPGGHLVSFGGSRTWHRLAAGVEDVGFEVRDSIAWLYGSGFPKSLDVSKAIDKIAPREGMFDAFAEHLRQRIDDLGMSRRDFVEYFPHYKNADSVMAQISNWKLGKNVPTPQDFLILRSVLGLDDQWSTLIDRVEAERAVVGTCNTGAANGSVVGLGSPSVMSRQYDVTSPGSDAAAKWQGWGTALKPSFEPIVVARKPLAGTVAANVIEHGTGAINIDACRVPAGQDDRDKCASVVGLASNRNGATYGEWTGVREDSASPEGRWPTNVVLDRHQADVLDNGSGGASRFFPTFRYEAKAPTSERPSVDGVSHPTVKPLGLMRWLVRLVTPPNGLVLDPFAGSGTTAEACVLEHMRCITVEREADYLPLIIERLSKPLEVGLDFGEAG